MKKVFIGVVGTVALAVLASQVLAITQLPKVCYSCSATTGVCTQVVCDK